MIDSSLTTTSLNMKRIFFKVLGAIPQRGRSIVEFVSLAILGLVISYISCSALWTSPKARIVSGDLNFYYAIVAARFAHGGPENDYFGFPYGQDLSAIPLFDLGPSILISFFFFLTSNAIVSVNLFLISTFVVNAVSSYYVSRVLGISRGFSLLAMLAISSLPWQVGRINHILLLNFMVCFTGIVATVIMRDRRSEKMLAFALGVVTGLFSFYFIAFAFFIYILFNLLFSRTKLVLRLIFPLGLLVGTVLNFGWSTSWKFQAVASFSRGSWESYLYGGVPFLPFIPLPWSNSLPQPRFQELMQLFPSSTESEGWSNYGGITMLLSFGVIVFAFSLVARYPGRILKRDKLVLSGLIGSFVLLFLFFLRGGLGVLFAVVFTPQVRAWNRITPLLQFLVLILAFYALKTSFRHLSSLNTRTSSIVITTIFLFGTISQFQDLSEISPKPNLEQEFELVGFASALKALPLRESCGILQVPYMGFPEVPPQNRMLDYDPILVPLYTDRYKWSYGVLKTQNVDLSIYDFSTEKAELTKGRLKELGYCAVLLDTFALSTESDYFLRLKNALGDPVLTSEQQRWIFFKIL